MFCSHFDSRLAVNRRDSLKIPKGPFQQNRGCVKVFEMILAANVRFGAVCSGGFVPIKRLCQLGCAADAADQNDSAATSLQAGFRKHF
jgi:hypothetical protein